MHIPVQSLLSNKDGKPKLNKKKRRGGMRNKMFNTHYTHTHILHNNNKLLELLLFYNKACKKNTYR